MVDRFTETTTTGWGSRLLNSLVGVILGAALFIGSFFVLFWNEGRIDLSVVAQGATAISPTGTPAAQITDLVSITGAITSSEQLGDSFIQPSNFIILDRTTEMYAWEEDSETETERNAGGSETRTTTYTYRKTWQENPENSSNFRRRENHENPPKSIPSQEYRVSAAQIGSYSLAVNQLQPRDLFSLQLNTVNLLPSTGVRLAGNYLYQGQGSLADPIVGDVRISYTSLPHNTQVTLFGELESTDRIGPYPAPRNISFYRLYPMDRTGAIQAMAQEHQMITWMLRGGGFLMMWFGAMMVLEPLSTLLDVLPFLGSMSRGVAGVVTFLISATLSGVTILVSIVVHNPLILAICVGITLVGIGGFLSKRGRSASRRARLS